MKARTLAYNQKKKCHGRQTLLSITTAFQAFKLISNVQTTMSHKEAHPQLKRIRLSIRSLSYKKVPSIPLYYELSSLDTVIETERPLRYVISSSGSHRPIFFRKLASCCCCESKGVYKKSNLQMIEVTNSYLTPKVYTHTRASVWSGLYYCMDKA